MKDIIKEILKESENEFDWIPELREVVVTNPGLRYPTHLEAMVALGVTGAKEFIDKFGIYYFNTEEFHKWRQEHSYHYGDDLFFSENGINLTKPIKGETYYISDLPYNENGTLIYKLISPYNNREFIIGESGFKFL